MPMELSQLKQFKQLSQAGSMQEAAEQLFTSQSALSKSLKKLESELGVSLFDRTKRGLQLNHYGKIVLAYTNLILEDLEKINQVTQNTGYTQKYTFCSSSFSVLNYIIPLLAEDFPEIQFESRIGAYNHRAQILNETFDFTLTPYSFVDNNIICTEIFVDQVFVAVPAAHPLAEKEVLHLEDLSHQTFAETKRGNPIKVNHPNPVLQNNSTIQYVYRPTLDSVYQYADLHGYLYFTDSITSRYLQPNPARVYIPFMEKGYTYTFYISYLAKNEKKMKPMISWLREKLNR